MNKKLINNKWLEIKNPNIGDKIYIPNSFCFSTIGRMTGGIATISKIHYNDHFLPENHCNYIEIEVEECPKEVTSKINYRWLMENQKIFKQKYRDKIAKSEVDYNMN